MLSLFPGADLLGMAFEQEGFCVVRGPELLLGGDIRGWHAPAGRFDGIIGGPPCKAHSRACRGNAPTQENLIPEFERVVAEARPQWWLCENVPDAPVPLGAAFAEVLDAWEFGAGQHRRRRFSSSLWLRPVPVPPDDRHPDPWPCITATEHKHSAGSRNRRRAGRKVGRRMTLAEVNRAMGLPEGFATPCLTSEYAYAVRGNGVPLPMGVAMARAVKAALLDTENHPRCTPQRRGNVAYCPSTKRAASTPARVTPTHSRLGTAVPANVTPEGSHPAVVVECQRPPRAAS